MKDRIELILSKGYFPTNELPGIFNTSSFAKFFVSNYLFIDTLKKASKCIRLSCPKVGLSRKTLRIPNPIHYGELVGYIVSKWETLESIFKDSEISCTKPEFTEEGVSRPMYSFKNYLRKCIQDSYKYPFELSTDIAKFYPSIYTHSIAWAVDGKEKSKQPMARKGSIGDTIDMKIRLMQDNQSIGIPIGPYCSQIISEIINCRIDNELKKRLKYLVGNRFIDDRKLYFENYNDAETSYNQLLSLLSYFELEPNTSKTYINQMPIPLVQKWIIEIQSFNFRIPKPNPLDTYKAREKMMQETDLINFFSIVFDLALKYPNDSVCKYSIKLIRNEEIFDENIELLESLMYKTLLYESSIIPDIIDFMLKYQNKINLTKVKIIIQEFIELHKNKDHDYEIIWALYLLKVFKITVHSDYLNWIEKYSNPFIKYLVHDLYKNSLLEGEFEISNLYRGITANDLLEEDWFFVYYAYFNDLSECDFSNIKKSEFSVFRRMKKNKIEFIDHNHCENILKIKSLKSMNYHNKISISENQTKKEGEELLEMLIY